jgi:hypothetical protein
MTGRDSGLFVLRATLGGLFLGSAQLGPSSFWQATVTLPNNQVGLHTLNFYTHSSASCATSVTSIPITTER